jgi:2-keto-4-pentenoate hydratase/2-oxohepta-3-ene-1,7-dioic acid hydratase in catechol pathway
MRLANLAGRLALVGPDGGYFDVEKASGGLFGPSPQDIYDRWAEFVAWHASTGGRLDADPRYAPTTELEPVVPRPRQLFAVGLNYLEHTREAGFEQPAEPMIFTKFASCLTGPDADIALPEGSVDWEVELVVVIGERAAGVAASDAWSYVAGLTIGQDLSERELQMVGNPAQFSLAKSLAGFGPIGPYVVTVDEFRHPDDLRLTSTLNGVVVQDGRTTQMMFSVRELIARLSAVCCLLPGDLVFTGTPPGCGMGMRPPTYLKAGDTLTSEIEGVGSMVHRFV